MSREMPNVPMIRPPASRNGILVVETHVSLPSGHVSFSSMPTSGLPVRMISRSSASAWSACAWLKKSWSVLPMASAVLPRWNRFAWASLIIKKRLAASLK